MSIFDLIGSLVGFHLVAIDRTLAMKDLIYILGQWGNFLGECLQSTQSRVPIRYRFIKAYILGNYFCKIEN